MSKEGIMPWMDLLEGVDATDLLQRRAGVADLARRAAAARAKALEFGREADRLSGLAHQEACALEGYAKGKYSTCAVEKAKTLAYS
jgi:hypothetical protein